jgi:hypothetical protein
MKDRKDHHPDFYAEDDDRVQFASLPPEDQIDIICDWFKEKPYLANLYAEEAISQMKPDSTVSDLLLYIARCISKHYEQEDWTI